MEVSDFSFLENCTALESLEIAACGIPEVHLPERVLKEKQEERPDAGHGTGVPFHMTVRVQGQYPYMLQELNSQVWAVYTGAYGDVWDYINILMGERDVAPEQKKLCAKTWRMSVCGFLIFWDSWGMRRGRRCSAISLELIHARNVAGGQQFLPE